MFVDTYFSTNSILIPFFPIQPFDDPSNEYVMFRCDFIVTECAVTVTFLLHLHGVEKQKMEEKRNKKKEVTPQNSFVTTK